MKRVLDKALAFTMETNLYKKVRAVLVYRPDDPYKLLQQWPQREHNAGVERIQGIRFPAPGSRPEPNIPLRDSEDDYFDAKVYDKDSRNLESKDAMFINSATAPVLIESGKIEKKGSANRPVNVAVKSYDATGLRSTPTATWAEMDKALATKAQPNHLSRMEWENELAEMAKKAEERGLPFLEGRRQKWGSVPATYNKMKW